MNRDDIIRNEFDPDWNVMAVMVEEQQRMAKRIEELEAALAQPEEPDWSAAGFGKPQREWQGLTDEEIKQLWKDTPQLVGVYSYTDIAREVEAKLKGKNA